MAQMIIQWSKPFLINLLLIHDWITQQAASTIIETFYFEGWKTMLMQFVRYSIMLFFLNFLDELELQGPKKKVLFFVISILSPSFRSRQDYCTTLSSCFLFSPVCADTKWTIWLENMWAVLYIYKFEISLYSEASVTSSAERGWIMKCQVHELHYRLYV